MYLEWFSAKISAQFLFATMIVAAALPALITENDAYPKPWTVGTREISERHGDGHSVEGTEIGIDVERVGRVGHYSISRITRDASAVAKRTFNNSLILPVNALFNTSLSSLNSTLTAIRFHVPRTTMELYITNLGPQKIPKGQFVSFLVDARESIREKVVSNPSAPISNNYFLFKWPAETGELRVYPYKGKEITWASLNKLLWGYACYTKESQIYQEAYSVEIEIEIEIDNDIVGHCSIRWTPPNEDSLAKRSLPPTRLNSLLPLRTSNMLSDSTNIAPYSNCP